MGLKSVWLLQGFFGDQDDDNETSMFFSNHPTMFRPDKEVRNLMNPTPLLNAYVSQNIVTKKMKKNIASFL